MPCNRARASFPPRHRLIRRKNVGGTRTRTRTRTTKAGRNTGLNKVKRFELTKVIATSVERGKSITKASARVDIGRRLSLIFRKRRDKRVKKTFEAFDENLVLTTARLWCVRPARRDSDGSSSRSTLPYYDGEKLNHLLRSEL